MKLQNAYDTISDPEKRRAYDVRWEGIRDSQRTKQEAETRQAEAAETERKRATEERARKERSDQAQQERLRPLALSKSRYDSDIFELSRAVRKLTADVKRLQYLDDEDFKKESERNSWWAYLASPFRGMVKETHEQKQARETERLQRVASQSIKVSELNKKQAKLQELQDALQLVNSQIAAEKKKAGDEARAQDRERQRKTEQACAAQEQCERWAKIQKEQAERAAKEAWEAQAAREIREAQERARKAAATVRHRREAEERAQAMRAAEEADRKAQKARNEWTRPATPSYSSSRASTCRHDKFWPKVEGRHLCSNCHRLQNRFAFQCPGCRMMACASCRQTLKGKGYDASRRFGSNADTNYDDVFSDLEPMT